LPETIHQPAPPLTTGIRTQAGASISALRAALASRELGGLELSMTASVAADWAYVVAAMLVAYRFGGAAAVGGVGLARMLVASITAPLVSGLSGRVPPRRILLLACGVRIAAMGVAAIVLLVGGSPLGMLAAVAVEAGAFAVFRPVALATFPAIARSPGELVSANLASSVGENVGTMAGPVLGGLVMGAAGPVAASALAITMTVIAVLGVAPLRVGLDDSSRGDRPAGPAALSRLRGGARVLAERSAPRSVVAVFAAQVIVRGMLNVFLVVASIELLGLGEAGVGALASAMGLGGLVGAVAAVTLVGRARLAGAFAVAAVAWGAPIAMIGLVPRASVALVALGIIGAANAMLDVSGFTLLQRTTPSGERPAVFGIFEGVVSSGVAVGSVIGPLLVATLGARVALVATGAVLPIVVLMAWRELVRADDASVIPARELELLRTQPMFAPLPLTVLEGMGERMVPRQYAPGELLTRQGDPGDSFYIIAEGAVEVEHDGRVVRTLGRNTAVGEIALLRHIPRTATVRATLPTTAYTLAGPDFIAAIGARPMSMALAEKVASDRLADR
jgi:MFS family permease